MGKIILYGVKLSPPVRTVILTLKALDVPFEFVEINLFGGEHLKPDYLEKNPQHTVPTLEDDGNFVWDSHAIVTYLVSKYGKTDELYPKDLLKRAVVDQRLHFESSVIFTGTLANITIPIWLQNETLVPKQKTNKIIDLYNLLETFLKNHLYIAGDHLTVADFSLITSITSLEIFVEIDATKYVKLSAWIERVQQLPYYEESNTEGLQALKDALKSKNLTIEQ